MKSPDSGNQRTGQPRCVQFTAKTWKLVSEMQRTQQGMSAVTPSQGTTKGFR